MMDLNALTSEYILLVEKGETIEAIHRFYDDNIIQVENNEPPIEGKLTLLEMEKKNIESVYSFSIKVISLLVDENSNLVMGEMLLRFNSKKNGPQKINEAFVQQWEHGKIKYQRFYYGSTEKDE